MSGFIVVIIALLIGGIVYFSRSSPEEKTREDYVKELAHFLEGDISKRDESVYIIKFRFESHDFIFEDVVDTGFGEAANKGYLKAKSNSRLNLYFSEKDRRLQIRTGIMLASNIPDEPIISVERVNLPKNLQGFNVHTNRPVLVNKLFDNPKIIKILAQFQNADPRGYPFMSLKIIEGEIILEFHALAGYEPNLPALRKQVAQMEDHLNKLVIILDQINQLSKDFDE